MQQAAAFVHVATEDFGIAMAEALACGTPVIAFHRGGASEIVRPLHCSEAPTGVMIDEQTPAAVAAAVRAFVEHRSAFDEQRCRDSVLRFGEQRFRDGFRDHVEGAWAAFQPVLAQGRP